jgi:hypothetical protein
MCPFTTSALHLPCLVRASFANKRNSTVEGWGLGAQCLGVEPELSSRETGNAGGTRACIPNMKMK